MFKCNKKYLFRFWEKELIESSYKSNSGCIAFIFMEPAFLVTRRWKICNCSQLSLSPKT